MDALRLYWLGPPRIELKGRTVKLETRKSSALLCYLSLPGAACSRESLATLFWPEGSQQRALSSLRRTLSSLKTRLPGWIQADREAATLGRNDNLWVDVDAFHQLLRQAGEHCRSAGELCDGCQGALQEALADYRGDFLEGLNLEDCPDFDEWQFFQRDGLRHELSGMLHRLSTAQAARGQWEDAILYGRRWLAMDRRHEPACRALMELYARSGQRIAALRQYEELQHLLKEQGAEPEQETRQLYAQIEKQGQTRQPVDVPKRLSSLPLLKTKLYVPTPPTPRVMRSRLIDCLDGVAQKSLTLLSTPAGFGKTTLLAEWIARSSMPIAWLSLDAGDNDPYRFLSYLVEALGSFQEGLGIKALEIMQSPQGVPPRVILASLINDLERVAESCVLILDDYQFVTDPEVHATVSYLLDHLPRNLHLVIATRSDPALQLGRLRADGRMLELRTQDLRFSTDEAVDFLNGAMRLGLSKEDAEVLAARTEGWAAGLKMAALSLNGRENASEFIRAFSGSHRYVLDYLMEEVLRRQPANIQAFLLQTSVLDKLSAPLCDVVVSEDAQQGGASSQAVLEYLERSNLFVIPLDDRRHWYRYHHLFADLLRARLDQLYPRLVPQLHVRAAVWFEQAGMALEAINHALAGGAHEQAARLVEENTARLFAQGELTSLMSWIKSLPAELRRTRPWLCVHQACALAFAGQPADMEPLLTQAEAAMHSFGAQNTSDLKSRAGEMLSPPMEAAEAQALRGAVATVRAVGAVLTGQDGEAVSQALRARELLPPGDLFDHYLVAWVLGNSMLTYGRLPEARQALEEQVRLSRTMDDLMVLVVGLSYLAEVLRYQGQLRQARARLEQALAEASRHGARSLGYITLVETSFAGVLAEQNELEAARDVLAEAFGHARQWPNPNYEAYAYAIKARVRMALGDLAGARTSIVEADRIARSAALTRLLRRVVERELLQTWLALQARGVSLYPTDPLAEQTAALMAAWEGELARAAKDDIVPIDEDAENAAFNLGRAWLALGRTEEALTLLERVSRSAKGAGHVERAIGSLVLAAIAWHRTAIGPGQASGQPAPALRALQEALTLAEPGGYVRVFLDEGQPMRELLELSLTEGLPGHLREYVLGLLKACGSAAP